MQRIRQIGEKLYACGDNGQTYTRISPDQWEPLDRALFRDPTSGEMQTFYDIHGPHEREIYIVGTRGIMMVWDGATVTPLPRVTREALISIFVEDHETIWVCGRNGTLLKGNRRSGFQQVVRVRGRHLFSSLTQYQGRLYLASQANPRGLFTLDGTRFQRVWSGLKPDIQDVHTVDCADGVLWVVGAKDILRFDGTTWTRIDHPDNPPVR